MLSRDAAYVTPTRDTLEAVGHRQSVPLETWNIILFDSQIDPNDDVAIPEAFINPRFSLNSVSA